MNSATIDGIEYRFFNHLYAISRNGLILRLLNPYTPTMRRDGYFGIGRQQLLHRAVAHCWCDRPDGANHVHHINEDKSDNRASNLIWLTVQQHSDAHPKPGRSMTEATKQKLRAARLGSVTSDETRAKQRAASLRLGCIPPPRPVGYKCSEQSRELMRENSPNASSCVIDGVSYRSFSEASQKLGIKLGTLRKRCLSESFPSYMVRGRN